MHHNPRKRFGQNFLIDAYVIANIIEEIYPQRDDVIIEIGPGLGALTNPLLQKLDHLRVIEIDRDIVEKLKKMFPQEQLTIYSEDALNFNFSQFNHPLRIIGNLPYNISTPLLFHLSSFSNFIQDMHFMLQKEVVDRMVAKPSTSDYGRLSVMLQYRFEMERILIVPPESFNPPPKVESAVIRMFPLQQPIAKTDDEALFARVVATAFSQRRKTLRNTLRQYLEQEDFKTLEIDSGLRAENLTITQYISIANLIIAKTS